MNDEFIYITAQQMLGYGSCKIADIKRCFGSAQKFIESSFSDKVSSGIFTKSELKRISSYKNERTEQIIKRCNNIGCQIIHLKHKDYPTKLKYIPNPPIVLYTLGDLSLLKDHLAISIVGARNIGDYAKKVTKILVEQLVESGVIIVSGGAKGVDSAAHISAIKSGGKTVGIIPCGLDYNYLNDNAELRMNISEHGALISEFVPGQEISQNTFHIRNRVISGISSGTVIIQAGERSGALITAGHALEQGRDVYVVPGSVLDYNFLGSHTLLRDGAKPVTGILDILENHVLQYVNLLNINDIKNSFISEEESIPTQIGNNKPKQIIKKANNKISEYEELDEVIPKKEIDLSKVCENSRKIYNKLKEGIFTIDQLVVSCNINIREIHFSLLELELASYIEELPGTRYKIA